MNQIVENLKSYPSINCNNALDNSDSVKNPTIGSQKFCGNYTGSNPSATILTTSNFDLINSINSIDLPPKISLSGSVYYNNTTNTCKSKLFNPVISNIEYECSGTCPPVYECKTLNGICSAIPDNMWTERKNVPDACNIKTTTGPNVVLVNNSMLSEMGIASPSSSMHYNQLLALPETDKNICPKKWTVQTNQDGSFKADTTQNKSCYCPKDTTRSFSSVRDNKTKKYTGTMVCK